MRTGKDLPERERCEVDYVWGEVDLPIYIYTEPPHATPAAEGVSAISHDKSNVQ